MKSKPFYKSMTFWGSVCLFVAGGLESMGVTGALEIAKQIASILGLPLVGYGLRRAVDKK